MNAAAGKGVLEDLQDGTVFLRWVLRVEEGVPVA